MASGVVLSELLPGVTFSVTPPVVGTGVESGLVVASPQLENAKSSNPSTRDVVIFFMAVSFLFY